MMNNKNDIVARLQELNLEHDEAQIYLELLQEPNTHGQLSRMTGINRTKVYRTVEDLERRGLISRETDDRGTFLVAADPSSLEMGIAAQETRIRQQREVLTGLTPVLTQLQQHDPHAFMVRTYEGAAGLKQMCWHELKAKGEVLALGNGNIDQMVSDTRWAAMHRTRQIARGYSTRELINAYADPSQLIQGNLRQAALYQHRILDPTYLRFDTQTVIYNDTVAVYHWKYDQKVGVEIICPTHAAMMRDIFWRYWELAQDPADPVPR